MPKILVLGVIIAGFAMVLLGISMLLFGDKIKIVTIEANSVTIVNQSDKPETIYVIFSLVQEWTCEVDVSEKVEKGVTSTSILLTQSKAVKIDAPTLAQVNNVIGTSSTQCIMGKAPLRVAKTMYVVINYGGKEVQRVLLPVTR